ncbi:hypothetical protein SEPCBS119000_003818 [Sporothrix epigloea]|uniref:Uncharacterized protein n=1 Tax=Sporothrix epigloea TaxID=1892477 RepID=A0ABP0DNY9_9PEZI
MAEHDGDGDVEDLDSAAIAAAMGFSSFGAQSHPNKKRRFNPLADAVIGTPRDSRPPARLPSAGTGANATRLPPRPPQTMAPAPVATAEQAPVSTSNDLPLHPSHATRSEMKLPRPTVVLADETYVNNGGDDDENDQSTEGGTHYPQKTETEDEAGPQYLDTSRPVGEIRDHLGYEGDESGGDMEGGPQDAALGLPPRPPQHQLDGASHSTSRQEAGVLALDRHGFRPDLMPGAQRHMMAALGSTDREVADAGGPAESETGDTASQQHGSMNGHSQGSGPDYGHSHGQQRDWWTGYYDPTSNENPWARVEAKLGLPKCTGSWLERGQGRGQHRS